MKITIAQITSRIADINYNLTQITKAIDEAIAAQSRLIIFPELALSGYYLKDLIFNPLLLKQVEHALVKIEQYRPQIGIIIGYPKQINNDIFNAAGFIFQGKIQTEYYKQALAEFECFNEARYFKPHSNNSCIITINNMSFALSICHDIWQKDTMINLTKEPVAAIINISASPYHLNKHILRKDTLKLAAEYHKCPIIYANTIGGHDSLIFDGNSIIVNQNGDVCSQLRHCQQQIFTTNLPLCSQQQSVQADAYKETYQALVLGIKDYLKNNKLTTVYIGISGGIDSAVVAALAVEALGSKNVKGVLMPSLYTSRISIDAAIKLASNLQIELLQQPITQAFELLVSQLTNSNKINPSILAQQNLQARLRGNILMYYANLNNGIVLNTGNKSEAAMGYCTLYGDMIGAFAPIGDLLKTQVFKMASYINNQQELIPSIILTRPPSAELAPNQQDTDQLLPYDQLDKILIKIFSLEQNKQQQLTAQELKIYKKLTLAEHKRQQAPMVLKISNCSWQIDRKQPCSQFLAI